MKIAVLGNLRSPLTGRTVQALLNRGVEPTAIVLDSREESERDLAIWEERTKGRLPPVPLHTFAREAIPVYFVEDLNSETMICLVQKLNLALLLNGGCPRILTAQILDAVPYGVLNIHPGLLPAYRGSSCVEWAIYRDEQVGNTVHFMVPGIDEGPIVLQEGYTFSRADKYPDIRVHVYERGFALLAKAAELVVEKSWKPADLALQEHGTYYKPIPASILASVITKLENGVYRYQV